MFVYVSKLTVADTKYLFYIHLVLRNQIIININGMTWASVICLLYELDSPVSVNNSWPFKNWLLVISLPCIKTKWKSNINFYLSAAYETINRIDDFPTLYVSMNPSHPSLYHQNISFIQNWKGQSNECDVQKDFGKTIFIEMLKQWSW